MKPILNKNDVEININKAQKILKNGDLVIFPTETVYGIGGNATDENANLSFDRERGGRARLGFRTNQPRTIGVTVRRSF